MPLSLRNSIKELSMVMVKWRNYFQDKELKILIPGEMLAAIINGTGCKYRK